MLFRTPTRDYRGDTAVGLIHAMRSDRSVVLAARRPSHAFLGHWLSELDRRASAGIDGRDEALAVELLLLCHEYRLGEFVRSERKAAVREAGDA
jgi:hypothetical protein